MHQSENSISIKEKRISKSLSEVVPTSDNVEFVILPYYSSLEAIPHKHNLFSDLNNFISLTDKNATIAILTSPIFANDFCAQLKHDVHLKLWITVKLEKPIEHKYYLRSNTEHY
jgi:hypothetical protein